MTTKSIERRPARRMRGLSPFFSSPLDRFFRNDFLDFSDGGSPLISETVPSLNIIEEKNNYRVDLAAPGLKKDDFNIDIDGNLLTVSCDKESEIKEDEKGYTRREYDYSYFSRTVTLPDYADTKGIVAKYTDGILHITIPKKPKAQKLTQKIKVQ